MGFWEEILNSTNFTLSRGPNIAASLGEQKNYRKRICTVLQRWNSVPVAFYLSLPSHAEAQGKSPNRSSPRWRSLKGCQDSCCSSDCRREVSDFRLGGSQWDCDSKARPKALDSGCQATGKTGNRPGNWREFLKKKENSFQLYYFWKKMKSVFAGLFFPKEKKLKKKTKYKIQQLTK